MSIIVGPTWWANFRYRDLHGVSLPLPEPIVGHAGLSGEGLLVALGKLGNNRASGFASENEADRDATVPLATPSEHVAESGATVEESHSAFRRFQKWARGPLGISD